MANLKQPNIIIVGAGIAGISAANRLRQAGFTDITILEAANRIGGRIHTVAFGDGDYPVELGANWIHGPGLGNSTFRVAEAIGALRPYRLNIRKSGRFMREDGTEIDRKIVREAIDLHRSVIDEVFKELPRQRITTGKIITVAPLFYDRLEEEVDKLDRDREYKNDLRRTLNALLNLNRFHEGDELERVTWEKEQSEYNIPPGGDVHIPGGYIQILEHLMKIVPKESLKLNTEVVSINWDTKSGSEVEVIVKDGSKFKANHVIVTCSLGYLKKHHESLFKPKLPKEKVDAINSLAIGRVNKIFLEFEKGLPLATNQNVIFAWETNTMDNKWYKRIFGFEKVFTKNNTYIGWISGDGAEYMERLSDEEIAKTSTQLLRKFLGKPDLPEPKSVLVTRWCKYPYALGTYTYQTKKMVPGEQTTLSEPLKAPSGKPLVQFAGEALANACTHGARDSGLKEAERLISLYSDIRVTSKL